MNRNTFLLAMEIVTNSTKNINGDELKHLVLINGYPHKVTSPYIFPIKNHHLSGKECVDDETGYPTLKKDVILIANL